MSVLSLPDELALPRKLSFLVLVIFILGVTHVPAVTAQDVCVATGSWISPHYKVSGKLAIPTLMKRLTQRQVVLLGETHDSVEDHRWQLQTIAALHAQRPDMVLGFEMFPRRVQQVLDRWVAGELSEAQFLAQSEWAKVWNYDPTLYLPLFHFARMNRVPMIALNVDRRLITMVREKGWDSVSADLREGLSKPAPPSPAYLEKLSQIFAAHSQFTPGVTAKSKPQSADKQVDADNAEFSRFVQSQQLWDRAMAEAIGSIVQQPDPPLVVGIMGAGHIINRYGVPHQLNDLGIDSTAVLLPWDSVNDCNELTPDSADAVFGIATPEHAEPERPRLGITLEENETGVRVSNVAAHSIAEAADIRNDDFIIEVAGRAVKKPADITEVVQRQAPGTWLPITLKRGDQELEIVAKFPARK